MALAAGTKLGPYEILAPLGAGGMGEVYRARDSRLNREVAVKVLPEHLARDPQSLARFEREAKAVAALSHPNILVLFDIGAHNGINFAVTELLEGETLRERLIGAALPWRKAAELGAAIAEGLAAAHSKGIVHRDLKPANIFLTADGRVKILDFGLARQRGALPQNEETATLTEDSGSVMGTIGYMSPEQVRGGVVEASSDIFSLGCVLYEMVTGRKAFSGSTGSDTLASILKDEPTAIADGERVVPGELQRVVERCLAKNPTQRFHSAHDLAFALTSLLTGAAERQPAEPAGKTVSRPAIVAAAFALAVVAAAALWYGNRRAQTIDSLAVLPFVNAGGNEDADYLSEGLTESLIGSLSQVPSLKVMSRNAVFRYKAKDTDALEAGRQLGVRAVLTGRIVERGTQLSVSAELIDARDNTELWGEKYDRQMADLLAVQKDIATQISEKLRHKLTGDDKRKIGNPGTGNAEAYQLYLKGRYFASKFTKEGFDKGMEYFRQAIAADPNYARAYEGIAYAYGIVDDVLLPPGDVMPKMKEAARKAIDLDDSLSSGHADLAAAALWYDYDWPTTERECKRAIELNPSDVFAHEIYGWLLITTGKSSEGIAENRRAVEIDPLSVEAGGILGQDLAWTGHYSEAVEVTRKYIDLVPDYPLNYWARGYAELRQRQTKEASAYPYLELGDKQRALDAIEKDYSTAPPT